MTPKAHIPIVHVKPLYLARPNAAAFLSISESIWRGLGDGLRTEIFSVLIWLRRDRH